MANAVVASGLDQPEGPAFLSGGRLLLVEMGEERACLTALDDGVRREVVCPGGRPTGLAIDGDDCLWVAGGSGNSLVKLALDGRELLRIAGDERGPFLFPNDLAFGPDGLLYLTDSGMLPEDFITGLAIREDFFTAPYAGAVFQIDPVKGRVLRRIDDAIRFTNGVAFGPDGALHVAETLTGRIYRYALDRAAARETFSETLVAPGETRFGGPDGMAFDTSGNLYCALYGYGEVSVSAPDGSVVRRLPTNGALPTNVAFLPGKAEIVVTEVEHGCLEQIAVPVPGLELHRPSLG